ncbi:MAG: RNA polymerase sporulation sigma factor SigH [Actinomycetota bacterium]|nr:RNA polymerase sporulation sigma factor SigH [Actinomycetota bacterium]
MRYQTREGVVTAGFVSDEELVALYRDGVQSAMEGLLTRYRNFARMKARSYFLAGADKDDIVQEGMIGLYKAIRDFSADRQASFRAFAEICITRQIITAVKTATRQKHVPLNSYVSLNKPISTEEDPDWVLQDVIQTEEVADPAELVISHDELRSIKIAFAEILSDFEAEVLHMYVEGKSYQEIAGHLGRHVKSIDNALQRIKRKVELHLRGRSDDTIDLEEDQELASVGAASDEPIDLRTPESRR